MALVAWSHEGHHSAPKKEDIPIEKMEAQALATIAVSYRLKAEPYFQKACFDCHGQAGKLPWYYSIPGVTSLIDSDIKEAKTHLDFSFGYPFRGHGTPLKDLEAIEKVIRDRTMPPTRYKIMHSASQLTRDEENKIVEWIQVSREALIAKPK